MFQIILNRKWIRQMFTCMVSAVGFSSAFNLPNFMGAPNRIKVLYNKISLYPA